MSVIDPEHLPEAGWRQKFRNAFRGAKLGMRGQSSFVVHIFMAAAVVVAAWALKAELLEWCVLALCIAQVLSVEMLNSALETLAKAVDRNTNKHVGHALDIASGAVLLASMGAMVVGLIVFVNRAYLLLK